jgi:hypothetical protein
MVRRHAQYCWNSLAPNGQWSGTPCRSIRRVADQAAIRKDQSAAVDRAERRVMYAASRGTRTTNSNGIKTNNGNTKAWTECEEGTTTSGIEAPSSGLWKALPVVFLIGGGYGTFSAENPWRGYGILTNIRSMIGCWLVGSLFVAIVMALTSMRKRIAALLWR